MRITLVVPGLLGVAPDVLARDAALSQVASLAEPQPVPDLDRAVLDDLDGDAEPAPLAADGAGIDVGSAWVVRADPIAMQVGRDDVRLAGVVCDLSDDERHALLALLGAHFASDGLRFVAPRADAWFALYPTPQRIRTTPPGAVGRRALRDCLPFGPDAARWRRWLTETQMLLHEHPLARRDGLPVTGVWFSGGGALPRGGAVPAFDAYAAEGRFGDLLRGLASLAQRPARPITPLPRALAAQSTDRIAIALPPIESGADLSAAMRDFVAPALHALRRGDASAIRLIADGNGTAASWSMQRPHWLARLLRRQATFIAPGGDR